MGRNLFATQLAGPKFHQLLQQPSQRQLKCFKKYKSDLAMVLKNKGSEISLCAGNDFKQSNYDTITVNTAAFGEYYNSRPSDIDQEGIPECLPKARGYLRRTQALRMEATKLSCFLTKFKANADKIVTTMESLEARVRECYEEPSDHLNSQEFVEMMVYDACFIVQLIRGDSVPDIFKERGIRDEIVNDLLLFENQLPFFVISKLYHFIMERDVHQLARDALSLFHSVDVPVPNKDFKHLLDLVYSCHRPSAREITQPRDFRGSIEFIGSATELDNAGIDFFGVTPEKIKDPKQGIETIRQSAEDSDLNGRRLDRA
ncbi:hypothetical protein V6N13_069565 [Hibiscus sabdariffa]